MHLCKCHFHKVTILPYHFEFSKRANDFTMMRLGVASMNEMCSEHSVALVKDSHYSAVSTGSTFAHELGHLFDMYHDNGEFLLSP